MRIYNAYGDLDHTLGLTADPFRNLQCLSCLDQCKTSCGCAPRWSWLDLLRLET